MTNKAKRNASLVMLIIIVAAYAGLFIRRIFWHVSAQGWEFSIPAFLFIVVLAIWRNYSQAVKEDEKYGPINKTPLNKNEK